MWAVWEARAPRYLCHRGQSPFDPVGTDRSALNVLPGTEILGAGVRGPGMRDGTQIGKGQPEGVVAETLKIVIRVPKVGRCWTTPNRERPACWQPRAWPSCTWAREWACIHTQGRAPV